MTPSPSDHTGQTRVCCSCALWTLASTRRWLTSRHSSFTIRSKVLHISIRFISSPLISCRVRQWPPICVSELDRLYWSTDRVQWCHGRVRKAVVRLQWHAEQCWNSLPLPAPRYCAVRQHRRRLAQPHLQRVSHDSRMQVSLFDSAVLQSSHMCHFYRPGLQLHVAGWLHCLQASLDSLTRPFLFRRVSSTTDTRRCWSTTTATTQQICLPILT